MYFAIGENNRKRTTLEELLAHEDDGTLINIQEELLSGIVTATSYAHKYCRYVNRLIDKGEMCINPTTYRKVYLPTLAKAVQKELAARYVFYCKNYKILLPAKELIEDAED